MAEEGVEGGFGEGAAAFEFGGDEVEPDVGIPDVIVDGAKVLCVGKRA